jgi:hypothetical protein
MEPPAPPRDRTGSAGSGPPGPELGVGGPLLADAGDHPRRPDPVGTPDLGVRGSVLSWIRYDALGGSSRATLRAATPVQPARPDGRREPGHPPRPDRHRPRVGLPTRRIRTPCGFTNRRPPGAVKTKTRPCGPRRDRPTGPARARTASRPGRTPQQAPYLAGLPKHRPSRRRRVSPVASKASRGSLPRPSAVVPPPPSGSRGPDPLRREPRQDGDTPTPLDAVFRQGAAIRANRATPPIGDVKPRNLSSGAVSAVAVEVARGEALHLPHSVPAPAAVVGVGLALQVLL